MGLPRASLCDLERLTVSVARPSIMRLLPRLKQGHFEPSWRACQFRTETPRILVVFDAVYFGMST
jgi:hypothetical protein